VLFVIVCGISQQNYAAPIKKKTCIPALFSNTISLYITVSVLLFGAFPLSCLLVFIVSLVSTAVSSCALMDATIQGDTSGSCTWYQKSFCFCLPFFYSLVYLMESPFFPYACCMYVHDCCQIQSAYSCFGVGVGA